MTLELKKFDMKTITFNPNESKSSCNYFDWKKRHR